MFQLKKSFVFFALSAVSIISAADSYLIQKEYADYCKKKSRVEQVVESKIFFGIVPVTKKTCPTLEKMAQDLATKFDINSPLIYILRGNYVFDALSYVTGADMCTNTFCEGIFGNGAQVFVGEDLLKLDDADIKALLAHEFAHAKNNHEVKLMIAMGTLAAAQKAVEHVVQKINNPTHAAGYTITGTTNGIAGKTGNIFNPDVPVRTQSASAIQVTATPIVRQNLSQQIPLGITTINTKILQHSTLAALWRYYTKEADLDATKMLKNASLATALQKKALVYKDKHPQWAKIRHVVSARIPYVNFFRFSPSLKARKLYIEQAAQKS